MDKVTAPGRPGHRPATHRPAGWRSAEERRRDAGSGGPLRRRDRRRQAQSRGVRAGRSRPAPCARRRSRSRRRRRGTPGCAPSWPAGARRPSCSSALEATGCLWEPLHDALTRAGLPRGGAQPAPDGGLGRRAGAAGQDRRAGRPDPGAGPAGGLRPGQRAALGDGPGAARADPRAPRPRPEPHGRPPAPAGRAGRGLPRAARHTPGRCDLAAARRSCTCWAPTARPGRWPRPRRPRWPPSWPSAAAAAGARPRPRRCRPWRRARPRAPAPSPRAAWSCAPSPGTCSTCTRASPSWRRPSPRCCADDEDGRRLRQLPGIGPIHAATIRAELGDVARFAAVDQVVAYAGLDPRTRQSGQFVGQQKLSKRGPGALRHALYLPRWSPPATPPSGTPATSASSTGAGPRRKPSPSSPAPCSRSSTTCCAPGPATTRRVCSLGRPQAPPAGLDSGI